MNKILRYSFMALLAMMFGNAMADDVIWSEDFSSYEAKDVPTGGTYNYVCTGTTFEDGVAKSGTMIYDANLAGGTSPELLVAKNGGSFQATIDLGSKSGDMTLSFKSNKALTITVTGGTIGDNTGTGNDYVYPITGASGSLVILFKMDANANARLDNIKLAQGQGKKPAGLSWGTSARTVTIGADDNVFPTLQNANNLAVTYSSSNETVATIAADGTITLVAVGKTTIKAESAETDEYEAGKAEYELTVKEPAAPAKEINVAQALEIIAGLQDGAKSDVEYKVVGFVINVEDVSTQYHNATFNIADATDGTDVLKVYRAKDAQTDIADENYVKAGDIVVVQGLLQKYVSNEVVTPEVAQGGKIYSVVTPEAEQDDPNNLVKNWNCTTSDLSSYNVHEWRTSAEQYIGAPYVFGGAVKVYVRSFAQAEAAGNATLVDGSKPVAADNFADWDSQFFVTWDEAKATAAGDKIQLKMKVKADKAQAAATQIHANPGGYIHWYCVGDVNITTEWADYASAETDVVAGDPGWGKTAVGGHTIAFNLAKGEENNVYFDNMIVLITRAGTGITEIVNAKAENAVRYNLAGQKVNNDYKGVVIMNGKKMLNK